MVYSFCLCYFTGIIIYIVLNLLKPFLCYCIWAETINAVVHVFESLVICPYAVIFLGCFPKE